jgi:hypothetical protein
VSGLAEPSFPQLQPEAVELLTAIRDHLDLPLPSEQGTKSERRQNRKRYVDMLEVRHADVVSTLNDLLAVPLAEVTGHAAQLRQYAAEETALYRWMDEEDGR